MEKRMMHLALFVLPHALVIIFCLLVIFLGFAYPFINSYALDAQENLYVGEGKTIYIFHQGSPAGKIVMKTDAYVFTVNDADELIVATPSMVYRMDTAGNILEKWEDPVSEEYQKIRNSGVTIITSNGDEYQKVSKFGWSRIIKNGTETVYQLSVLSFVVKLLLFLCFVSLFVNGLWMVYRLRISSAT